jgi:FtsH-binding integral membrane protein
MIVHSTPFRVLALVVLVVVAVTFATPRTAEADVMSALAITGIVVAGVILIAFLIVAATRDSSSAGGETRVVWMACTDTGCDPITSSFADLTSLPSVEGP